MSDLFSIARIIIGLGILGTAALSDLRTRTASSRFWMVMGSLGIIILAIEILTSGMGEPWNTSSTIWTKNHLLGLIPIIILFYDVFWDREPLYEEKINFVALTVFLIAVISAAGLVWLEGLNVLTAQLLVVPLMIIIGYVFFYTGLLHGGADAKAFMAISVLTPFYPIMDNVLPLIQYPEYMVDTMSVAFPFSFLVLMNASIISVVGVMVYTFLKNLARKDIEFPEMLLGYKMAMEDIPKKFVWPLEVVRDGELVLLMFPKRNTDIKKELDELRKRGLEEVWVSMKIPFIIPIFLGFIFSFVVGNLMTLIFNAI